MLLTGVKALGESISSDDEIALGRETKARPVMLRSGKVMTRDSTRVIYDFASPGAAPKAQPDLGLPSVFSERLVMQSRHQAAEGVAFIHSTGLGLNRAGSSWHSFSQRGSTEEQSLFFHDSGLELKPAAGLTLRVSSRLAQEVAPDGSVRNDWSSGLVAAVSPMDGTTIYAGIFGSTDLLSRSVSRILTGGIDSRLPGTSLSLSASGWTVLGTASTEGGEDYSVSGGAVSLSWQVNEGIWQTVGLQSEANEGSSWSYALWRCYISTVFWIDAATSYGLELSYTQTTDEQETVETELAETRLRVTRTRRLLDNLTAELSLEWAIGSLTANANGLQPTLRFAGQFAF